MRKISQHFPEDFIKWSYQLLLLAVMVGYFGFLFLWVGVEVVDQSHQRATNSAISDTSAETTDRILNLLDTILGVVALILPLSIGLMAYIYRESRIAQEKIAEQAKLAEGSAQSASTNAEASKQSAGDSLQKVAEALTKIKEIEGNIEVVKASLNDNYDRLRETEAQTRELNQQVQDTLADIQHYRHEAEKLQKDFKQLEQSFYRKQLLFEEIDQKSLLLFQDDETRSQLAMWGLIEYSRGEDPLVRLACVRAFSKVPEATEFRPPKQPILDRLKEMTTNDPEPAIRLEANTVLKKFPTRRPKEDKN
jgi:hypothetical protein